jgi:Tol biopolymer transport system component
LLRAVRAGRIVAFQPSANRVQDQRPEGRLDLWKDIATYLNRGVSTVQRWEKREGMPVHRHLHDKQGSVYAYRSEIDAWWASRRAVLEAEEADEALRPPAPPGETPPQTRTWPIALAFAAGCAVTIVLSAMISAVRVLPPAPAVVRFHLAPPPGTTWDTIPSVPNPSVSPDGRHVAFVAIGGDGQTRLWLQSLDSHEARLIRSTEDATYPFWSPDGRFIAFFVGNVLKKVRVAGGPVETISDLGKQIAPDGYSVGGTWNRFDQILFGGVNGLTMVPAAGGPLTTVTTLDRARGDISHGYPQFLPDGRGFMYFVKSTAAEHRGLFLGSLDSRERKRIAPMDSNAAYAAGGYVLFVREATLVAQRVDIDSGTVAGEPVPIASGVIPGPTVRYSPFSVSADVLAYRTGGVAPTQLVRIDRSGRTLGNVGPPGSHPGNATVSPDGTQLAMGVFDMQTGGADLWIFDVARGGRSRFTFHRDYEMAPLWARDGRSILFAATREGRWDIYERSLDDTATVDAAAERPVVQSRTNKYPQSWSADGRTLVFSRRSSETGEDIWLKYPNGEERPLVQTAFHEREADVSPDGAWIAYTSQQSGQPEVYLRQFPSGAGEVKVSVSGGAEPHWGPNGRELFYVAPDRRIMAVTLGAGAKPALGLPVPLSERRLSETDWWDYVVLPDGTFIVKEAATRVPLPLTVVINWREALTR